MVRRRVHEFGGWVREASCRLVLIGQRGWRYAEQGYLSAHHSVNEAYLLGAWSL